MGPLPQFIWGAVRGENGLWRAWTTCGSVVTSGQGMMQHHATFGTVRQKSIDNSICRHTGMTVHTLWIRLQLIVVSHPQDQSGRGVFLFDQGGIHVHDGPSSRKSQPAQSFLHQVVGWAGVSNITFKIINSSGSALVLEREYSTSLWTVSVANSFL